jgi:hypothetical protein
VVAGVEAQKKLFDLMEPMWEATKGTKTIVVAPVVRYITKSCCDDPDHMPNRHEEGFVQKYKKEVGQLKNKLKEHLFAAGHLHCRVLDPSMDIANKEHSEVWGEDPTMPVPAVFDSMIAAMAGAEARIDLLKKRPGENLESLAKKPRTDMAAASTPVQPRGGGVRSGGTGESSSRGRGGVGNPSGLNHNTTGATRRVRESGGTA